MARFDPTRDPDDVKLRELILFIAQRSCADERFGSVKLNKLLFFSDFLAFVKLGSSITGHAYFRLPKGPAPKKMIPIVNAMQADGSLAIAARDYHGHTQKVPVALRSADLSFFTADEIAVVTEVLEAHRQRNAKGISTISHQFAGWELAKDQELIPYQVALVQFRKPRKRDIDRAMAMGDELSELRREFPPSDVD